MIFLTEQTNPIGFKKRAAKPAAFGDSLVKRLVMVDVRATLVETLRYAIPRTRTMVIRRPSLIWAGA